MYDWLGILGQAIGISKINTPGLAYCSEDVAYHCRKIGPYVANKTTNKILSEMPCNGSPEDLNSYMKKHKDVFQVYLKWEEDDT